MHEWGQSSEEKPWIVDQVLDRQIAKQRNHLAGETRGRQWYKCFTKGMITPRRNNTGGESQDRKERHLLWALTAHTRRLKKARLCNWEGSSVLKALRCHLVSLPTKTREMPSAWWSRWWCAISCPSTKAAWETADERKSQFSGGEFSEVAFISRFLCLNLINFFVFLCVNILCFCVWTSSTGRRTTLAGRTIWRPRLTALKEFSLYVSAV